MKLLVGVIPSKKIEAVKKALWGAGVRGVTISHAEGYGYQKVQVEQAGPDLKAQYQPRMRVEIALPDGEAARILDLLVETVRTGRMGDGKFFVLPLEDAVRVRTGERGEDAL